MKKVLIFSLLMAFAVQMMAVNVKLNADKSLQGNPVVVRMEQRLGALLSEINAANSSDRPLNLQGLGLSREAQETLNNLWVVAHFYCDDEEVTDRLWSFRNNYMVRSIPLIIVPDADDKWAEGTFQEAVVEFDKSGNISDFRFSFSSRLGQSMEMCKGTVVDVERQVQILSWCDRLATAYNEHNMKFMQQVFSDKALIITGKVITQTNREFGTTSQKVVYSKQTKRQYLTNLAKCFARNKWIKVDFDVVNVVSSDGSICSTVTQSNVDGNYYGVRLHQSWKSTHYSDEGYVFILWNFKDETRPQIEVRTWQPEIVNGKRIEEDDIISMGDFERDLEELQNN